MADIIRPIEPFELTQGFGEHPEWYARFGLKGHNGWDLRTKFPDTPNGFRNILAPWLCKFYVQGNEGNDGYGLYFEVIIQLYNTWKLTLAHCNSIESFQTKNEGETMAISDNTGNSTGSHLHLTVKKGTLSNGKFTNFDNDNGYFGAVEPQIFFDELRKYKKEHGTTTTPEGCLVPNTPEWRQKYEVLVGGATKWAETLKILEISDDPSTTPSDKIKSVVAGYKSRETDLANKLMEKQKELDVANQEIKNREEQVSRLEKQVTDTEKYYKDLLNALKSDTKNLPKIVDEAQGRIKVLEGQLDEANKAKGRALNEAAGYKSELEACRKGQPATPTKSIINTAIAFLTDLVKGFFKSKKEVKKDG